MNFINPIIAITKCKRFFFSYFEKPRILFKRILIHISVLFFFTSCAFIIDGIDSTFTGIADIFRSGRRGELTETEREWAKTAWKYFENNYNKNYHVNCEKH